MYFVEYSRVPFEIDVLSFYKILIKFRIHYLVVTFHQRPHFEIFDFNVCQAISSELKTLERWISRLMGDPRFFLISRLI